VHIRVAGLALPAVIGIGVAVASCNSAPGTAKPAVSATRSASGAALSGSPSASPASPSSPGSVPTGYTRIGDAAQGISVAVPASWLAVNLAKETPESAESAARNAGLSGINATTIVQELESLQRARGVAAFDVKSAVDSRQHYPRNLNAYCQASGTTDVGAAGVPLMKPLLAAADEKGGATNITIKDLQIGGVPGVEATYQISSSDYGTLYGWELVVLPKPDKMCYVDVYVGEDESEGSVPTTAAATALFPSGRPSTSGGTGTSPRVIHGSNHAPTLAAKRPRSRSHAD
jgi:hypothetical protein